MSSQILYSSIRPELKLTTLRRGSFLGTLGIAILLCMGTLLDSDQLKVWGIPGFLTSGALITLGLRPYRRLISLETRPHYLKIGPSNWIEFGYGGKPFLELKLIDITNMSYKTKSDSYGIVINVNDLQLIQKLHMGLDLQAYAEACRSRYGGELFFPFFSQRSFDELRLTFELPRSCLFFNTEAQRHRGSQRN